MTPLVKAIVYGGGLKVVGVGLTFLFFLLAAREISEFEYGVFGAVFSAATLIGFFAAGGQHLTLLRFWPVFDETVSREAADWLVWQALTRVALLVCAVSFLLFGVAAVATVNEWDMLVLSHTPALIAMTAAFALSEVTQAALRARGEILLAMGGREVIWRLISLGGLAALVLTSGSSVIFLAAASLLLVSILQFVWVWRAMDWQLPILGQPKNPPESSKREAQASQWFWLNTSIGPITQHAGTLVVAITVGPVAAGGYFAADKLAKLLSIVLMAVSQVIGPLLSRNFGSNRMDEVQKLVFIGTLIASSVGLSGAAAFAFLGDTALALFSEEYRSAYGTLMILVAGQVANIICGPCSIVMNMANLEKENTIIALGGGLFALPLLFVSGSIGGAIGVAICSASLLGVTNFLFVFVTWRKTNMLPWVKSLRKI